MRNDRPEDDPNCIAHLLSAVESASQPEIERIVQAVINQLQSRSPIGIFEEVAARHMWDEYCWVRQEGPFDDNLMGLGSLSGNWDFMVRSFVSFEIEALPSHWQMFLSVYASEHGPLTDEYTLGSISVEDIESVIMDKIAKKALLRNLDLIGPYRGDVIGHQVSSKGLVCSTVSSAGLLSEILASHVKTMIDAEADLSEIALEIIDTYLGLIYDQAESSPDLCELFARFEADIKVLLKEKDVLPGLRHMQGELLAVLDA